MSEVYRTFTSESVTQGHPDKVADIVSDAILDAYMAQDPMSHVACETCVTTDFCMVFGEIKSDADITDDDIKQIIRDTIIEIGYDKPDLEPGPGGPLAVDQHEGSPDAVPHPGCGLLISTSSRGPTVFLF